MNSTLPTISMVTCSYQQSRFLDASIRSVLSQNYSALDYIVMDGGSTDGSRGIIESHSSNLSHWVSEPDGGQTDALIRGFQKASGEICAWLCSDDILLPGTLTAIGTFFRDNPDAHAVYGDALWIDINGDLLRPKREMQFSRFVLLHDHNYIPQPSMFWRRSFYESVGGLDSRFNLAMDCDLWDRFSSRTKIAYLPGYLSCMRYYAEQKTRHLRAAGRLENAFIRRRSSRLSQLSGLNPVWHASARALRMLLKGLNGGYSARVPTELTPWLEAHATPEK